MNQRFGHVGTVSAVPTGHAKRQRARKPCPDSTSSDKARSAITGCARRCRAKRRPYSPVARAHAVQFAPVPQLATARQPCA